MSLQENEKILFGRIILLIQYKDNENFVLQAFHINI